MLRQGARLEIVRNNMGHVEYRRDPECLRKSWWEERVDAVAQAVEAVTNARSKCRERSEKESA
jgi:hypothetical protein